MSVGKWSACDWKGHGGHWVLDVATAMMQILNIAQWL